jgi:hypothetical protein
MYGIDVAYQLQKKGNPLCYRTGPFRIAKGFVRIPVGSGQRTPAAPRAGTPRPDVTIPSLRDRQRDVTCRSSILGFLDDRFRIDLQDMAFENVLVGHLAYRVT